MRRYALLLVPFLAVLAVPSLAELIPVTFEATINTVAPELESAFTVGETVTGSFLLDTEAADLEPQPDEGDYEGISDFTADFGGFAVTGVELSLHMRNGEGAQVDNFYVSGAVTGSAVAGLAPTFCQLNLGDADNTLFSSEAIPAALDLADFEIAHVSLFFLDGSFNRAVDADVTELTYGVPEASGALLTLAGAVTLAASGRIRARRCEERWARRSSAAPPPVS